MNREVFKFNVELITPVHVGSGQTLTNGFDFISIDNKTIGIISINKLSSLLDKKTIDLFIQAIQNNQNVSDFIKKHLGAKVKVEDYIEKKLSLFAKTNYTFLKQQYHSSIQGASIPGSSLKGALKTAIWRYFADDKFNQSITKLDDLKKRVNNRLIWNDENIEKKLFGKDANYKLTRFLSISDMYFGSSTEVHEIGILNMYNPGWNWKKEAGFLVETICPKTKSTVTINFKKDLKEKNLKYNPQNWHNERLKWLDNINDFFSIINDYTINRTQNEIEDLQVENFDRHEAGKKYLDIMDKIKEEASKMQNGFILRVGGNVGWEFITGGWIRKHSIKCFSSKEGENAYWELKKTIQKNKIYNTDIWGKTRKMTIDGVPLGFIKFTI